MIRTNYLTLPIRLFQKILIDNVKIVNIMLLVIELEKEHEQIVMIKDKNLCMELSNNIR